MTQKQKIALIITVISLVVMSILIGVQLKRKQEAKALQVANTQKPPSTVIDLLDTDYLVVAPQTHANTLPFEGQVFAKQKALVKASLPNAEMMTVLVREGQLVKKNQLLATMDDREIQNRRLQALSTLDAAQSRLNLAKNQRDKNKILLDKGFISTMAYENHATQTILAQSDVNNAKTALNQINNLLDDLHIRAPISGVIAARFIQIGERPPPDLRLFEIVNLSEMELEATIPSQEIANIHVGQSLNFSFEGGNQTYQGRITRLNPSLTPSRTLKIYASIVRSAGLKNGQYVQGQILISENTQKLVLPQAAVYQRDGQSYVYTIDSKNKLTTKAISTQVQTGVTDGQIEVIAGLDVGDRVIAHRFENLRVGSQVNITQNAPSPQQNK